MGTSVTAQAISLEGGRGDSAPASIRAYLRQSGLLQCAPGAAFVAVTVADQQLDHPMAHQVADFTAAPLAVAVLFQVTRVVGKMAWHGVVKGGDATFRYFRQRAEGGNPKGGAGTAPTAVDTAGEHARDGAAAYPPAGKAAEGIEQSKGDPSDGPSPDLG
ncbi:hypothetical protein [Nocardia salmonicida]|uniref:hypothetical protein n=1 Tax=Nocardia salmonicida TaxID=53431 RepID=UPI0037B25388